MASLAMSGAIPSAPANLLQTRRSSHVVRSELRNFNRCRSIPPPLLLRRGQGCRVLQCRAEKDGSTGSGKAEGDEKVPVWAQPGSSVPPPWAREGDKAQLQTDGQKPFELPFGLYLLFSVFTGIATVGSIFEFTAGNPIFGVLPKGNPLWAPILLFFAVTGFPTSAFLLFKAIGSFNKYAEEEDRQSGL